RGGRESRWVAKRSPASPKKPLRRGGAPPLAQRLAERALGDLAELDEDRGVAVEVRDREERARARREGRILLLEVRDAHREDRPGGRRLLTEAREVSLREGPLPREGLLRDEPGSIPVPRAHRDLGERLGDARDVFERGRHWASVARSVEDVVL